MNVRIRLTQTNYSLIWLHIMKLIVEIWFELGGTVNVGLLEFDLLTIPMV